MASNRAQEGSTESELADVIRWVRGHKVILDQDLACLYSVEVRALNQAVKRNPDRFPADFMFQLTAEEAEFLRSQSVILESDARSVAASKRRVGRGRHAKYLPNAFTGLEAPHRICAMGRQFAVGNHDGTARSKAHPLSLPRV
jgi:ORF6N domain